MSMALARRNEIGLHLPGIITLVGLQLPDDLPFEEWQRVGDVLRAAESGYQWWIGDWLNFGQPHYGEKYSQELQEKFGVGLDALTNYSFVARKYQFSIRIENVSWTHHLIVAGDKFSAKQKIAYLRAARRYGINKEQFKSFVRKHEGKKRVRARQVGESAATGTTVLTGDFRDRSNRLGDESVELMFTDPPYGRDYLPEYGELAEFAARVLKPGGSLITYCGHYAIPEILELMQRHLRYWWIISLEHSGRAQRLDGKGVFVKWKPLLWFVKDTRRDPSVAVDDLFRSNPPERDSHHEWQQDTSEAEYYIRLLTEPGDLVADPFVGGGTTLVAALKLGRRGWGCDIDPQQVKKTRERLRGIQP